MQCIPSAHWESPHWNIRWKDEHTPPFETRGRHSGKGVGILSSNSSDARVAVHTWQYWPALHRPGFAEQSDPAPGPTDSIGSGGRPVRPCSCSTQPAALFGLGRSPRSKQIAILEPRGFMQLADTSQQSSDDWQLYARLYPSSLRRSASV